MVPPNHHRRRDIAAPYRFIERQAEPCPIAHAKPADPGGESLELHPLPRQPDPVDEVRILREQLENDFVRAKEILRIAGEGDPAERPLAFAEQGTDVLRDEPRNVESILDAGIFRL